MKRILLSLVAIVAAMNIFAGESNWQTKQFSPTSSADDLKGIHTTVASDGSVYVSSTIDQTLSFGDSQLDPDLLSSCVVKYDAKGEEKWAVLLYGSCVVTAMTTDADGNVYVAGTFQDALLTLVGTDGEANQKVASGSSEVKSAFVAKITADGGAVSVTALTPQVDEYVSQQWGDPWGEGFESPLYMMLDPIYLTPTKILVDGEKVYVGAMYQGDVETLGWEGRYSSFYGMMYLDATSAGVFSLNSSDLSEPKSVCNVGSVNVIDEGDTAYNPDCINFVVKDGNVYVAFFGWGKLTLATPTGSKDFEFNESTIPDTSNEHALVLSDLSDVANKSLEFRAPEIVNVRGGAKWDVSSAEISGNNVVLSGSFGGQLTLDNKKFSPKNESEQYLGTAFAASFSLTNVVNWTWVDDVESSNVGAIVTGEETHVANTDKVYHLNTATGEVKNDDKMSILDGAQADDKYVALVGTEEAKVLVMIQEIEASAVQTVKAVQAGEAKFYSIDGMETTAPQKGLNIVKTADGVKKVIK